MLIHELGESLNLSGLEAGDDGTSVISTADGLDVLLAFSEDADELLLCCEVGTVTGEPEEVHASLLKANLDWQGCQGAALSLAGKRGQLVVLQMAIPCVEVDKGRMRDRATAFIEWATHWRGEIATIEERQFRVEPETPLVMDPSRFV